MSTGKQYYIDAAGRATSWHQENIERMRRCRFDTIAVHGIYSMQEALDFNQGSIIEPVYMSTSQAYRDADEMEAALGYEIPTWCYSRIANPSMYYLEGVLALLDGYGAKDATSCVATSSGMAAIMAAADPLLAVDPDHPSKPINFVATCQVYGGTFQQFAIRKQQEETSNGEKWFIPVI